MRFTGGAVPTGGPKSFGFASCDLTLTGYIGFNVCGDATGVTEEKVAEHVKQQLLAPSFFTAKLRCGAEKLVILEGKKRHA